MPKRQTKACQTEATSPIVSEDYSDIILRYQLAPEMLTTELSQYSPQIVDTQYSVLHAPLSMGLSFMEQIGYPAVPKLFTPIDTVSLETAGILAVQNQPFLNLTGKGVMIGFLDSGIDYTHPAFRNPDGTTKILRIWDQTIQTGPAPFDLGYGTEYTENEINAALFSGNPSALLPHQDESGHGTFAAGIACGSPDPSADFIGAAPDSSIIAVKLKPAKKYLRDYFIIPDSATAYQESDLMLGIRYMTQISRTLRLPLVICITVGTNQGGHTGTTPLEEVLTQAQFNAGIFAVTGTGNEVGQGHHYFGTLSRENEYTDVEILIEEETDGFSLEFWADAPELYSIGFTSPLGETIEPVQPRSQVSHEFSFLLENSRVNLIYSIVEMLSGAELAFMRFLTPTPGVWKIRIKNLTHVNGQFHLWLPITNFVNPDIRFYSPNTDTTLVIPACADALITTGTYNAYTNSMYRSSGRGYTRNGLIKPDFTSPGVSLTAPAPGGGYSVHTGSCVACALAAGATALVTQSGLKRSIPRYFTPWEIKSLFQRGTKRSANYQYPNRESGYGLLDVYGIYEAFLRS